MREISDSPEVARKKSSERWISPAKPSATFFEFVQRDPSPELLKQLETASNREAWFKDKTFLGLYNEKENEYKKGKATPFIPDALAKKIAARLKGLEVWEIEDALLDKVEAEDVHEELDRRVVLVNDERNALDPHHRSVRHSSIVAAGPGSRVEGEAGAVPGAADQTAGHRAGEVCRGQVGTSEADVGHHVVGQPRR